MADDTAFPVETSAAQVVEAVRAAGAEVIDLQFSDITGGAKALTIPVSLLDYTLANGYRFDGSALAGQRQIELTLAIIPDPSTLVIFPDEAGLPRRARICGMVRRLDGSAFPGDPRSVLVDTLEQAQSLGYDYRVSMELEYYLINEDPATIGQLIKSPLSHPRPVALLDARRSSGAGSRRDRHDAFGDRHQGGRRSPRNRPGPGRNRFPRNGRARNGRSVDQGAR
ncbi:MAG: glutamine synthetase beta-grasp domain-containing protein [Thermomicrobiales bacterium]